MKQNLLINENSQPSLPDQYTKKKSCIFLRTGNHASFQYIMLSGDSVAPTSQDRASLSIVGN
jgi:hypothetical protein